MINIFIFSYLKLIKLNILHSLIISKLHLQSKASISKHFKSNQIRILIDFFSFIPFHFLSNYFSFNFLYPFLEN